MVNKKNIESWLEEKDYFEFSKLLEIDENPLSITLGYMSDNEVNKYNRVKILPVEVKEWKYNKSKMFFPSESTDIRNVEFDTSSTNSINLKFIHSFAEILLKCKQFETEELSAIEIRPKLNFNETWVTLSAPPQQLVTPSQWLKNLKERKFDASFRMYGGEPKEVHSIAENYTGYCISKNDRINENPVGVFVSAAKSTIESMYLILQCQDNKSYDLWIELIDIFSEIENSKISIGDISFNKKIWKSQYLNQYKERL